MHRSRVRRCARDGVPRAQHALADVRHVTACSRRPSFGRSRAARRTLVMSRTIVTPSCDWLGRSGKRGEGSANAHSQNPSPRVDATQSNSAHEVTFRIRRCPSDVQRKLNGVPRFGLGGGVMQVSLLEQAKPSHLVWDSHLRVAVGIKPALGKIPLFGVVSTPIKRSTIGRKTRRHWTGGALADCVYYRRNVDSGLMVRT